MYVIYGMFVNISGLLLVFFIVMFWLFNGVVFDVEKD